ncbi:polysaccharide ABC transporter ATP-binding protein [Seonamhaeicola sp.]|uniref:ABC transporter ATP-binding protein n=1 Tax=Seonamhaeicola sp. TaxID=1912245 RepID=UPI00356852DC
MSDIILKVENLSKQYRLGVIGTGTVKDDLKRWWYGVRGKPDPFQKIGEENDRTAKAKSNYVWALKDINFEVKQGEVLGIIGKNGAGKSTLLKILSKITSPTTGCVKSKGTVASLLEVGTGFHAELTGRENIYLNGAILGMTKKEIASKIDEIIEFSGCERYIDTPVKRYSSGMTVRLAFAVAAFLEPDILIIDEVLAVGDAEFQKKAIGKMQDISRGGGRTVLFVSHNMAAVKKLCTRAVILENGIVTYKGEVNKVVEKYLSNDSENNFIYENNDFDITKSSIKSIKVFTSTGGKIHDFNEDLEVQIEVYCNQEIKQAAVSYQILNFDNIPVIHELILSQEVEFGKKKGFFKLTSKIRKIKLYQGVYKLNVYFADNYTKVKLDEKIEVCYFDIINKNKRPYYWQAGSAIYKEDHTSWQLSYKE